MGFYYVLGKTTIGAYLHLLYKVKVTGHENIPKEGACILCVNHISFIDPMMIGTSIRRPISFLAKKEIFKNKFFSYILKQIRCIPVDRNITDMEAYKKTLAVLKNGDMVGIFAQGTRLKEIEAKNAKAGVAFFAMKSNAPVIPVCITPEYKKFKKVYINIGKPVDLDEFKTDGKKVNSETLELITEKIMKEVSSLQKTKDDE